MVWNGHCFNLNNFSHREGIHLVGIYFIVAKYNGKTFVLKVGKADGKQGFYKRFNMYSTTSCDDSIVDAMPNVLKKFPSAKFFLYYHSMEKKVAKYLGHTFLSSPDTRSLEEHMARLAEREGHPMLLSRCK